jgi:hypothetical protein
MLSEILAWLAAWLALSVPPVQPVSWLAGGTAKAAGAMATSITAMSAATVANNRMRFILASPFPKWGGSSRPSYRPELYNAPTLASICYQAHPLNE